MGLQRFKMVLNSFMMVSDHRKAFWHDLRPDFGAGNSENAIFELNFVHLRALYTSYITLALRPCRAGVMSRRIEKSWDFTKRFRRIQFSQKVLIIFLLEPWILIMGCDLPAGILPAGCGENNKITYQLESSQLVRIHKTSYQLGGCQPAGGLVNNR